VRLLLKAREAAIGEGFSRARVELLITYWQAASGEEKRLISQLFESQLAQARSESQAQWIREQLIQARQ